MVDRFFGPPARAMSIVFDVLQKQFDVLQKQIEIFPPSSRITKRDRTLVQ